MYVDKSDPDTLHDEITVIDHALTRPWTVDKRYKRDHDPIWFLNNCSEEIRRNARRSRPGNGHWWCVRNAEVGDEPSGPARCRGAG